MKVFSSLISLILSAAFLPKTAMSASLCLARTVETLDAPKNVGFNDVNDIIRYTDKNVSVADAARYLEKIGVGFSQIDADSLRIHTTGSDPLNKLAKKVSEKYRGASLIYSPADLERNKAAGMYSRKENRIYMPSAAFSDEALEHTTIHEILHAATETRNNRNEGFFFSGTTWPGKLRTEDLSIYNEVYSNDEVLNYLSDVVFDYYHLRSIFMKTGQNKVDSLRSGMVHKLSLVNKIMDTNFKIYHGIRRGFDSGKTAIKCYAPAVGGVFCDLALAEQNARVRIYAGSLTEMLLMKESATGDSSNALKLKALLILRLAGQDEIQYGMRTQINGLSWSLRNGRLPDLINVKRLSVLRKMALESPNMREVQKLMERTDINEKNLTYEVVSANINYRVSDVERADLEALKKMR